MKLVSLGLLVLTAQGAWAFSSFSADFPNIRARVIVEEKLEPQNPKMSGGFSSGIGMGGPGMPVRHTLTESSQHVYSGYDIQVLRQAGDTFRVTLVALTATAEELKLPDPSLWRRLPAPNLPGPQLIHAGDTLVFDLFEDSATGQKIVDSLRIENNGPCDGQQDCLAKLVAHEAQSLATSIADLESKLNGPPAAALAQSQQTWEQYKQDTCGAITDSGRQLSCKLILTRSRQQDLTKIY